MALPTTTRWPPCHNSSSSSSSSSYTAVILPLLLLVSVSVSLVSPSTLFIINIALVSSFSLPKTSNYNKYKYKYKYNNCNRNYNYNYNRNKCFRASARVSAHGPGVNFYRQRSRGNSDVGVGVDVDVDGAGSVSSSLKMVGEGVSGGAATSATASSATRHHHQKIPVWQRLSECFRGDFDNYAQVLEDREQNLEPREGGGHEHFHCTLVPLTESTRLAAFYFDGNPDRIFRFRYYELIPASTGTTTTTTNEDDSDNDTNDSGNDNTDTNTNDNTDTNTNDNTDTNEAVEMYLNTLHPDLERLLKSHATDPLCWPGVFENFRPAVRGEPKVTVLKQCEISWSREIDPVQHSYLADNDSDNNDSDNDSDNSLHAVMIHGPTIVDSTIVPGMRIRIVDQLSLYRDVFYINDRGFDPVTGGFIYGNQREVPYRLERVSTITSTTKDGAVLQRQVVNPDLEWTIGPDFRTTEEYDRKLQAIGGPSVKMNKKNTYKSNGNGDGDSNGDGDGDGPAGK